MSGELTASHDEVMLALNDLEEDCYERRLKVDADVVDGIDIMEFDDLSVDPVAASSEAVSMVGWGVVVGRASIWASAWASAPRAWRTSRWAAARSRSASLRMGGTVTGAAWPLFY